MADHDGLAIGIDLATANARALACDPDGRTLARAAHPMPAPRRRGGASRQQPAYWPVAQALLAELVDSLGPRRAQVRVICVTGTSGSLVPCDRRGLPVGDASLYDDAVAADEARLLSTHGLPAGPTSPLARLGWLARHEPAALYLHTNDVVNTGLVGRPVATDTSHALKEGIDPVRLERRGELQALLHVDPATLPALVHPGTVLGEISPDVAETLGLPPGTEVVAGMTDGCTAQVAAGAVVPGRTVGVLGTTLVLKAVSPVDVSGFDGAVYSHHAPDGLFWPGGASNVGAGAVGEEYAGADLAALDEAAAAHGPGGTVRYPLTGRGERFPFHDADARGFTVPVPGVDAGRLSEVDDYRALLEGVAFVERLGLETLARLGVPTGEHRVAGGGSASRVWNQVRATTLGRPVTRTADPQSAFGAAVLATVAATHGDLTTATDRMVHAAETVDPVLQETEALEERYQILVAELAQRGHGSALVPAPHDHGRGDST